MTMVAGRASLTALALLGVVPMALAQAHALPPPPTPAAASPSPAAADETVSLSEQLGSLRRERAALASELDRLRSRPDAAVSGSDDAQRIADLETRLEQVEAEIVRLRREAALQTPAAVTGPRGPADPTGIGMYNLLGQSSQVTSGTAFNPSISVILDGVYFTDDRDGASGEIASEADGFPAGSGSHGGGVERGFSLREAEITFSGSVDPYFDVWAIFAVADGEVEVEEGYVQTRKLIPGMQLKFGKFYSGVGYINRQHPHQWDFVDQALPYDAIFAGALNEAGAQLTWLPNLSFYTQLGVEALQGENEGIASQAGGGEETPWLSSKAGPRLFTGFLKVSPNVGYSHTLQLGASYGHSSQHRELHDKSGDGVADEAFEGPTWFFGADAVWRYDSPRQYGKGDLSVQAEYLYRVKDLDVVDAAGQPPGGGRVKSSQDGLYVQAVYGLFSRWTAGVRFDTIGLTNRIEGDVRASLRSSRRYTADLTFNPTEFSRLRAQFAHGAFRVGGNEETFNQFFLQFQMSLGAHGAHKF